jgi:hypothetical protein
MILSEILVIQTRTLLKKPHAFMKKTAPFTFLSWVVWPCFYKRRTDQK